MLARNWWTLPAGLMWVMTRNEEVAEKVQTDPTAVKGIALGIAFRLAEEAAYAAKLETRFSNSKKAWLAVRDLIADEKIRAEGVLIERRIESWEATGPATESYGHNAPIPSGEAANLVMLDNWAGFTETVLGPDEMYRFYNGQGRYWKRVRLCAADMVHEFPLSGVHPTRSADLDSGLEKIPRARGRTKGSGSYEAKDAPLVEEALQLLERNAVTSVLAAAKRVAHKSTVGASEDANITRIAKRIGAKLSQFRSNQI
jgi:hypothetical protein